MISPDIVHALERAAWSVNADNAPQHLRETTLATDVNRLGLFDLTGDTAPVPHLLKWLAKGPDLPAGDVHRALVRLTGHDPLIPEDGDFSVHVRRIWPRRDLSAPPKPALRDVVVETPRRE